MIDPTPRNSLAARMTIERYEERGLFRSNDVGPHDEPREKRRQRLFRQGAPFLFGAALAQDPNAPAVMVPVVWLS